MEDLMSRKKKKDKAAHSTRELMGISDITEYSIATKLGDLVFFIIKPSGYSHRTGRDRCDRFSFRARRSD